MKVCGIELKGNDAIVTCLQGDKENFHLIETNSKKIGVKDSKNQADIQDFSKNINAFLAQHQFDRIGIKARSVKGKFAGGPTSFKLEALIQNTQWKVEVIHGATIRAALKAKVIDESGVNKYQVEALMVARYLLEF